MFAIFMLCTNKFECILVLFGSLTLWVQKFVSQSRSTSKCARGCRRMGRKCVGPAWKMIEVAMPGVPVPEQQSSWVPVWVNPGFCVRYLGVIWVLGCMLEVSYDCWVFSGEDGCLCVYFTNSRGAIVTT